MTDYILRDQAMKEEMGKPWLERQVTHYLGNVLFWVEHGYTFTEEQREALMDLWEKEGEDD